MPEATSLCTLITLKATTVGTSPGKPPWRNYVIDLEVKNPSSSPVWVLLDRMESGLPAGRVSLLGAHEPGFALVWMFDGVQALRISAAAEVTFRKIAIPIDRRAASAPIVLAREVRIAGKPAREWLGQDGLIPPRGTFRFDLLTLSTLAERNGEESDLLTLDGACDFALAIENP